MAKEKQSPRQRMINLMYLVFIAMLAMQIDQEILRSFYDTQVTLEDATKLTNKKNDIFAATLRAKAANSPETFGPLNEQYQVLAGKSKDFSAFLEDLKTKLQGEVGFSYNPNDPNATFEFNAVSNVDAPTHMFFNNADSNSPSTTAKELKLKIDDYRNYILSSYKGKPGFEALITRAEALQSEFVKKRDGKNWITAKFYNQPLVAALANIQVIQSEVKNIESDVLSLMLQEQVDANIKFDQYQAIVAAPNVVMQGDKQEAKVFVGTYTNSIPVSISGVDRQANGQGFKSLNSSGVGSQSFSGVITFKDSKGKPYTLPYKHDYTIVAGAKEVALQDGALVSADKMNVMYRGIPNPVSGSILGADNTKVNLSAPGHSISGGKGRWTVTPGGGTTVELTISGPLPNGKMSSTKFPFRIKNIPPPQGQIRGQNVLTMPASSIPNQTLEAAIPDFDFPVSFTIQSCMVKFPGRASILVSGGNLGALASQIKTLRPGDVVGIFNIKASATGLGNQQLKTITPVIINVQ